MNDNDGPVTLGQAIKEVFGDEPLDTLLHPEQRALTWGSAYAVFGGLDLPEPELQVIVYGMVPTQPDAVRKMRSLGVPVEVRTTALAIMQHRLDSNYLIGATWSPYAGLDAPQESNIHKALAWPIPREVLMAASAVGFVWDRFDMGTKAHLGIACANWRTHQMISGMTL